MTISPAHMQRLLALKLDPEPMAEVLSIIAEVDADNRNALRNDPSPNAVRQKRYRERLKALQTVTERNESITEHNVSDNKVINNLSPSEVDKNKNLCRKSVTRNAYPPLFETFWKTYPKDSNMSKAEALPEWNKLSTEDQQKAVASLSSFKSHCSKNPDYRPIHAVRYLKFRRFDGHAPTTGKTLSDEERNNLLRVLSA